jgi:HK97 family phage major capsid protein
MSAVPNGNGQVDYYKRQALIDEARGILNAAKAEQRGLSEQETQRYDAIMADVERPLEGRSAAEIYGLLAGANDPRGREGDVAIVAPDQRVASFVRSDRVLAHGDQAGLGRILRARITGDQSRLNDVERRVLSESTDSAGGFTVPEHLGAQIIDRVRNSMVCMAAGARTVAMDSDTLNLARLATGPSLAWKTENAAITASDLTFERVQLVAKTLPVLVKMSVELAEDSIGAEAIIEQELARALALELDRVALRGSGVSPEPKGIRNQTGVTVTELGSGDGAVVAYSDLLDGIGTIWAANGEPSARIYAARTAKTFAKLVDSTGQPLRAPEAVANVKQLITNSIPTTLTVGESDDCSEAYIGRFSDLLIGLRTSFRLEASRVSDDAFSKMQVHIRAYLRADVALAHPEQFVVLTGVRA